MFSFGEESIDSSYGRTSYALLAAGSGVVLVVFVTICCCGCDGVNFFIDKPETESSDVRKMRAMKNRIDKENESGKLSIFEIPKIIFIQCQCHLDMLQEEFRRDDHQDAYQNDFL